MGNETSEQKFISAKSIAIRWDIDISVVRRKLAQESIGFRLGTKKGSSIRYPLEEIEKLEKQWRKERL